MSNSTRTQITINETTHIQTIQDKLTTLPIQKIKTTTQNYANQLIKHIAYIKSEGNLRMEMAIFS